MKDINLGGKKCDAVAMRSYTAVYRVYHMRSYASMHNSYLHGNSVYSIRERWYRFVSSANLGRLNSILYGM